MISVIDTRAGVSRDFVTQRKVNRQRVESHILALNEQENEARNALGPPESKPGIHRQLSRLISRVRAEQQRLRKMVMDAEATGVDYLSWSELATGRMSDEHATTGRVSGGSEEDEQGSKRATH